jgi:phenylalanyl-tRNA synthetase alpha chain
MNHKLYKQDKHPLNTLKLKITDFFINNENKHLRTKIQEDNDFKVYEDFHSIVSTEENFFNLLVDKDHETVSPKNTYYWDTDQVLRTHMTAHDVSLLKQGHKSFITVGDVYRRDSIDATHYPIFHQVDGVRLLSNEQLEYNPYGGEIDPTSIIRDDLKYTLQGLIK